MKRRAPVVVFVAGSVEGVGVAQVIIVFPPARQAIAIGVGEGVGVALQLGEVELHPVADVGSDGAGAINFDRVWPGAGEDVGRREINREARVAINGLREEQHRRSTRAFETHLDVVFAETFATLIDRRTEPHAAPDKIKAQTQPRLRVRLPGVQEKVDAVRAVAIGEGALPALVRFLNSNDTIRGQIVEARQKSSRAIKVVVNDGIVRGINRAGSRIVEVVLGGKFIHGFVAIRERVFIHANRPDGLPSGQCGHRGQRKAAQQGRERARQAELHCLPLPRARPTRK